MSANAATPKVSILMIAYNNVRHVAVALMSVMQQSYQNWELIFQDDCSTDGTFEVAALFAARDSRIKLFRNPTNIGIVKNRARAMRNSTGELITHVDADDMLYPYSIDRVVLHLMGNPNLGLVYTDRAQISDTGQFMSYIATKSADMPAYNYGWMHMCMYRRSAYSMTKGYNEELISACEDGDLFMQIIEHHSFARIPEVLYMHRAYDGNSSKKNKECKSCSERPVCNYIRVWSKAANYDPITFTPLEKKNDDSV